MEIETIVIPLIVGFIATLPALYQWRKYQAEAKAAEGDEADKVSAAWERLNKPLLERISALEQTVIRQAAEIDELQRGISILQEQVRELGGVPRYPPTKKTP